MAFIFAFAIERIRINFQQCILIKLPVQYSHSNRWVFINIVGNIEYNEVKLLVPVDSGKYAFMFCYCCHTRWLQQNNVFVVVHSVYSTWPKENHQLNEKFFLKFFFSYRSNEITIRIDGIFFSIPENIVENEERVIGFRFSDIPQYKTDKGGTSNKKEKLLLFFLQIFFTFEFQIDY